MQTIGPFVAASGQHHSTNGRLHGRLSLPLAVRAYVHDAHAQVTERVPPQTGCLVKAKDLAAVCNVSRIQVAEKSAHPSQMRLTDIQRSSVNRRERQV